MVNPAFDPTFSFMTVDHDGAIRMDCSSPYAMARLVGLKDRYRVAFANDPDSDRHGIVTPIAGLMNPNHYLSVAILYLLTYRPHWPAGAAVGKTLVSSSMIDRVVRKLGRRLSEVPVGFKWCQSVDEVVWIAMGGAVSESKQRVECRKCFDSQLTFHILRLIKNKYRPGCLDKMNGGFTL